MTTTKTLVVIFGAGATRGAFADEANKRALPPPPVDQDFFEIAGHIEGRGTRKLAANVINDVYLLYGRVSGIGLEQYFQDIETRAELGSFAKAKGQPKDWAKRKENLEELIRRVLIHTTCNLDAPGTPALESKLHAGILKHLKPRDTIVTFNYDTVIEESFSKGQKLWRPGDGYGVSSRGKTHEWARRWLDKREVSDGQSLVHLLKLHGSLNWSPYHSNSVWLKSRPYFVNHHNGIPNFAESELVPPGWHKKIHINPYRQFWKEARSKLERCRSLAIIGYSLPETDLLARSLFAEVCRSRATRNDYLRHLYLADPQDIVKARLVDMFTPALGPKGHVYRFGGIAELNKSWATNGPTR